MPHARRTESAEADLQEIGFQIAVRDQRPATADRVIDELIQRCERLAQHSENSTQGTAAPELGSNVRLISHGRWVIVFRYESHGVDILRFADENQDYMSWRLM